MKPSDQLTEVDMLTARKIEVWVRNVMSIGISGLCFWLFSASPVESFIVGMCARLVLEIET